MTQSTPAATVYLATNLANGKTYVGVTRRSIATRWSSHVYVALRTAKTYFHRAIAKYGPDSFKVEPIASCLTVESAVATECEIIKTIRPDYNQTNGGEFTVGRRASRETCDRIAAANRGKRRTPEMNAANGARTKARLADPKARKTAVEALNRARGRIDREKQRSASAVAAGERVWTPESRAKLSASCMGRRHPREVIERMAATKNKAVVCVETGKRFKSVSEAANAVGLSIGTISRVCRGIRPTAGGMQFTFEREL